MRLAAARRRLMATRPPRRESAVEMRLIVSARFDREAGVERHADLAAFLALALLDTTLAAATAIGPRPMRRSAPRNCKLGNQSGEVNGQRFGGGNRPCTPACVRQAYQGDGRLRLGRWLRSSALVQGFTCCPLGRTHLTLSGTASRAQSRGSAIGTWTEHALVDLGSESVDRSRGSRVR